MKGGKCSCNPDIKQQAISDAADIMVGGQSSAVRADVAEKHHSARKKPALEKLHGKCVKCGLLTNCLTGGLQPSICSLSLCPSVRHRRAEILCV